MQKKILFVIAIVIVIFIAFVFTQPDEFNVSRTDTIAAPASTIFAEVSDLHKWQAWSPWAKLDPKAKNSFGGPQTGVGSNMEWESDNRNVGEGKMTIVNIVPDESIKFKLEFEKPFSSTSTAEFSFKPEGNNTQVTWNMSGEKNFMGKAMGLFFNCEKMVGDQFELGLKNLKSIAETKS